MFFQDPSSATSPAEAAPGRLQPWPRVTFSLHCHLQCYLWAQLHPHLVNNDTAPLPSTDDSKGRSVLGRSQLTEQAPRLPAQSPAVDQAWFRLPGAQGLVEVGPSWEEPCYGSLRMCVTGQVQGACLQPPRVLPTLRPAAVSQTWAN